MDRKDDLRVECWRTTEDREIDVLRPEESEKGIADYPRGVTERWHSLPTWLEYSKRSIGLGDGCSTLEDMSPILSDPHRTEGGQEGRKACICKNLITFVDGI